MTSAVALSAILRDSIPEIDARSSDSALIWYPGLKQAMLSLEQHPNRCAVTPETDKLRHLLYGNKPRIYRVIYGVIEKQKQVYVLHIRHSAWKRLMADDLL